MPHNLSGTLYAIAAFGSWGLLPLYWKLLKQVPAPEILAHRVLWACLFVCLILFRKEQWRRLKDVWAVKTQRRGVIGCAAFISVNWALYIWAVNAGHVVDASLGYYINPLFSVFLGLVMLRERLRFWQYVALGWACVGVVILTVEYGRIPWIALTLAFSFGMYGFLKKIAAVEALIGLGLETLCVAPLCLAYIVVRQYQGVGAFGTISLTVTALLICSGVITALPLLWFAEATKRIPLSSVGFLQYLSPTLMLACAILLFHEAFTPVHLVSFGCIWGALLLYSLSHTGFRLRRPR